MKTNRRYYEVEVIDAGLDEIIKKTCDMEYKLSKILDEHRQAESEELDEAKYKD